MSNNFTETLGQKWLLLSLLILMAVYIVMPSKAFSAFNDVSLTTDTVISVGGVSISVSGSSATLESITVDSSNFSFELESGSSITFSSSDRIDFSVNSTNFNVFTRTCSSTESKIAVEATTSGSLTVTPLSGTECNNFTGSGSSGGASNPTFSTTSSSDNEDEEETDVEEEETETTEPTSTPAFTAFTTNLSRGSQNSAVKRLQELLNSDPDTQVASAGVGSPGNETNYFGSLTELAVQKFQAKYGIVSSGTPDTTGYGLVGPLTIKKINEVFGGSTDSSSTPSVEAPSALFSTNLSLGLSNNDVRRLQQLLNSDPNTQVASVGPGSSGNETNYFGSLTQQAVQKFQIKYSVVSDSSEPGYGFVGPKTRAKLQEVFGQ